MLSPSYVVNNSKILHLYIIEIYNIEPLLKSSLTLNLKIIGFTALIIKYFHLGLHLLKLQGSAKR